MAKWPYRGDGDHDGAFDDGGAHAWPTSAVASGDATPLLQLVFYRAAICPNDA